MRDSTLAVDVWKDIPYQRFRIQGRIEFHIFQTRFDLKCLITPLEQQTHLVITHIAQFILRCKNFLEIFYEALSLQRERLCL